MTHDEWEQLCDHCGKCCLLKLEDEDTKEVFYTNVTCQLFDISLCRCSNYENRNNLIPSCLCLSPTLVKQLKWLPSSCAYRRLSEGKDLEWWHPKVSGTFETVFSEGISVFGKIIHEKKIDETKLEDYIINWIDF